jgi:hypothetical protein
MSIVADGIDYCLTTAHPTGVGYWIKFSNGVVLHRAYTFNDAIVKDGFETDVDLATKDKLATYLACASGGTFSFSPY